MKYDNKKALKIQMSVYLEESLSMVGRMMLEDIYDRIDAMDDNDAETYVEAHYDDNIFDLIAPYLDLAAREYEIYKQSPEGIQTLEELKEIMEKTKDTINSIDEIKALITVAPENKDGNDNEGNGNVH